MVMDKAYEELKGKYEKSCIENDAIKREREQLLREREKLLRERQQLKGKGQKLKQRLHALAPTAAPALIAAAALPSATLTAAIANGRAKRVVSGAQGIGVRPFKEEPLKYDGSFLNNMKHGHGTLIWADGREYEGIFVNDLSHGEGISRNSITDFKEVQTYNHGYFVSASKDKTEILRVEADMKRAKEDSAKGLLDPMTFQPEPQLSALLKALSKSGRKPNYTTHESGEKVQLPIGLWSLPHPYHVPCDVCEWSANDCMAILLALNANQEAANSSL